MHAISFSASLILRLLACAALLTSRVDAFAGDLSANVAGYWNRSDQGWFWYHDPPPPPPPEKISPSPAVSSNAPDEPAPLSARWFREHLDSYRDAAIDNPSPENVRLYLYLQRLAMDKAEMYSHATKLAVLNDPALDQATLTPTNNQSRAVANQAHTAAVRSVLGRVASTAGIWFFFRSDCPYCHAQAPVLQAMAHLYGFKILPISIDHAPLVDGSFPDWVPDGGQAARMHVTVTPTLFLVAPPDRIIPLGEGVMASDQLEDRIVELEHQSGAVNDEEYASINAYQSKSYLQNGLPSDLSGIDKDPDTFLALLHAAAEQGGRTPIGNLSSGDVNWRPQ